MVLGREPGYFLAMDGKVFISLVVGVLWALMGLLGTVWPVRTTWPWSGPVALVTGAIWLAGAFYYWRRSRA